MPCYVPQQGYQGPGGQFVTAKRHSQTLAPMTVPCGRCIGCRMDRAQDWGTRIAHECKMHEDNSFLTLTYRPENLPDDYSVHVRPLQLFIKKLRDRIKPTRIRFYACGEYGDEGRRPHYHLIIFGYSFPDKKKWRTTKTGFITYRSAFLDDLWPDGNAEIGTVTQQSGAYVARYCLKKITGPAASDYYTWVHPSTGESIIQEPEFAVMSSRPGIGYEWLRRFESDAFPSKFIVINGKKRPVPSYYYKKLRERNRFQKKVRTHDLGTFAKDDYERLKLSGKDKHEFRTRPDNSPARLATREESQHLKQARIKREEG